MKFALPKDETSSMVRVTARTGSTSADWSYSTTLDNSHQDVEINVPSTVDQADVEVVAEPLTGSGAVVASGAVVLKTKERKKTQTTGAVIVTPVTTDDHVAALKESAGLLDKKVADKIAFDKAAADVQAILDKPIDEINVEQAKAELSATAGDETKTPDAVVEGHQESHVPPSQSESHLTKMDGIHHE